MSTGVQEDSLFGCDEIFNDDFFNPQFQHLNEHNYAAFEKLIPVANSMEPVGPSHELMTPMVDDLAFVEDLVPLSVEQDPSPSSSTSPHEGVITIILPPSEEDPLPLDLGSFFDQETLKEALCLVEMPPAIQNDDSQSFVQEPDETTMEPSTASLVSTLFDFISSSTPSKPMLPMYVTDDSENSSSPEPRRTSNRNSRNNSLKSVESDIVTEEERSMMLREGCVLQEPVNPDEAIVLTEEQERVLRNVRRKMRNKESAKESRKRKADYIDTLEKRVKVESSNNGKLKTRVQELEQENEVLSARLQYMQEFVQKLLGGRRSLTRMGQQQSAQKSTCFLVMLFALCLVIVPRNGSILPSFGGDLSPLISTGSSVDNVSALQSSLGDGIGNQLIPQSFIFTYETMSDRAADL